LPSTSRTILRCSSLVLLGLFVAGCKEEAAPARPLTRVRTVTVQPVEFSPTITLTGTVEARNRTDLSFRISGKISERYVNPGEHVTADQVLARLESQDEENEVRSAKAGVESAESQLRQATAAFERQRNLLASGNTTRRDFDQAEANQRSAAAQLEQARAQLNQAENQLSYTVLRAGAPGIIVSRMAEAGQVVSQAQPVYTLALDGPRDAVFNVHEWALANLVMEKGLAVSLVSDHAVTARGSVREISPVVDARTMTIRMKVGLAETPPLMTLGALVNGAGPMKPMRAFLVPWGSMFEIDGKSAMWVVDPRSTTVSLKPVTIERYTRDSIAVIDGLQPGEIVVTAGAQLLRPGQKVEIAEQKP
jgi:RND family efflux transporter MFP subunit